MQKIQTTMRIFATCLVRELKAQRAWLVALLLFSIFSLTLLSSVEVNNETAEESMTYDVSLVLQNDDNSLMSVVIPQIETMPHVGKVHLDTAEKARERLENNTVLFTMTMPEGFMRALTSGSIKSPAIVAINPNFPFEAELLARTYGNFFRALSYMNLAGVSFQELYDLYSGKGEMGWVKLSTMAFNTLSKFGTRFQLLITEDFTAQLGVWQVIVPFMLIFALIPGMLLLDRKLAEKNSSFTMRLTKQGARGILVSSQISVHLLLALVLTSSFIIFIFFYASLTSQQSWLVVLYILCAALSSILLGLMASNLFKERERAMINASILFLLLLFLSGMLIPLELLPEQVSAIAPYSPWHGYYFGLLDVLTDNLADSLSMAKQLLFPLLAIGFITIICERRGARQ